MVEIRRVGVGSPYLRLDQDLIVNVKGSGKAHPLVNAASANCAPTPCETGHVDLDIVGSIAMTDENGKPTEVWLLLTRGMDTTGIAETFKTDRRVDMDGGAVIRRPGEPDDAFGARLQAAIDALVASDPPTSRPAGTLATEVNR